MKIEIDGVHAREQGAEMLLTVRISDGENAEIKKILLPFEKYIEFCLCKGKILDGEIFDEIEGCSKRYTAIKKASDLLSYGMSSKKNLSYKLKMKGFDRESSDAAVEYLASKKVVDEESDAEKLVLRYMRKLWGKKRIYSELIKKGYSKDVSSAAVRLADDGAFVENCVLLIRQKNETLPEDPVERNKLINSLLRYGYSFSEIHSAFEKILDSD